MCIQSFNASSIYQLLALLTTHARTHEAFLHNDHLKHFVDRIELEFYHHQIGSKTSYLLLFNLELG